MSQVDCGSPVLSLDEAGGGEGIEAATDRKPVDRISCTIHFRG